MTDRALLDACLTRGEAAWPAFVGRFTPYLAEVCRRTLVRRGEPSGPQEVDDQVQGVFLRLWKDDRKALRAYQGRSSVSGYLGAVAVRHVQGQSLRALPAREPPTSTGPLDLLVRREEAGGMVSALEALPPRTRLALVLQAEGASIRQVALALGMTEPAAAQVLSRARKDLKKTCQES